MFASNPTCPRLFSFSFSQICHVLLRDFFKPSRIVCSASPRRSKYRKGPTPLRNMIVNVLKEEEKNQDPLLPHILKTQQGCISLPEAMSVIKLNKTSGGAPEEETLFVDQDPPKSLEEIIDITVSHHSPPPPPPIPHHQKTKDRHPFPFTPACPQIIEERKKKRKTKIKRKNIPTNHISFRKPSKSPSGT